MSAPEIKVKVGADTKGLESGLDSASGKLKSFGSLLEGFSFGAGVGVFETVAEAIHGFVEGSIEEFEKVQASTESLKTSLEAVDRIDAFENISKSSKELHEQFKFLEESDIQSAFNKLIQVGGLTEDQMNRLIPVIVNLNAKQKLAGDTNKSLAQSAQDVVRGLEGQSRTLKDYGVVVSQSNTEAQNFGIIIDVLGQKVKGAGDAFANSFEGRVEASTERVKELQEQLGSKLLPLKAGLLSFANDVADGFGLLIDRLTLGADAFKAVRDLKVRVSFVQSESNRKFDAIKDLPLDELTSQLITYQSALDRTNAAIKANKSGEAAIKQWKLESEVVGDLIGKIKEQIKVRGDTRTIGDNTIDQEKKKKASADTEIKSIKDRIAAIKELQKVGTITFTEDLQLKQLDIKLIQLEGAKNGLTQDQINRIIIGKYPEFKDGLTYSKVVPVTIPFKVKSVADEISAADPAGDNLTQGIDRMVARLQKQGKKDGDELRKSLQRDFGENIQQGLTDSFAGIGESIGNIFTGDAGIGDAAHAFLSVIGETLQEVGKQIIFTSTLVVALKKALTKLFANPAASLALGIGLVALGQVLKNVKLGGGVKRLADGGITTGPTVAMIGEAGREVVLPLNRLNSLFDNHTQDFSGELRARGNDLVLVHDRVRKKQKRTR